jgi:HK97 family phage prohead protease
VEITRNNTHPTKIEDRNGRKCISGYGAVWYDGTEATEHFDPEEGYYERFDRHSFDKSLASNKRKASCYNHSWEFVLGRSDLGTASFWTDDIGMAYSVPHDETDPDHVKVERKWEKDLITGSSVRAKVKKGSRRFFFEGDKPVCVYEELDLVEAGPVDEPAFSGTSVMVRSAHHTDEPDTEYRQWRETQERLKKFAEITR